MAKVMTIRPPENTKNWLTDVAKKRGLTVNALVNQILWEYKKNHEANNKTSRAPSGEGGKGE